MKLVENVIYKVSKAINHSFYQDPQLLTNLYAHLSMRLSRKKKFVNEYNPESCRMYHYIYNDIHPRTVATDNNQRPAA